MRPLYSSPGIVENGSFLSLTHGLPYAMKFEEDAYTMIWDNVDSKRGSSAAYSSPRVDMHQEGLAVTRGTGEGNKMEPDLYTLVWDNV